MINFDRNMFTQLFRNDYNLIVVRFSIVEEDPFSDPARRFGKPAVKTYTYKLAKDEQVKPNDIVVVDVNGSIKLAQVVSVNDTPALDGPETFRYKWALGTLNEMRAKYEANLARDKQIKVAVAKLEAALTKKLMTKQLTELLAELPSDEADELRSLFAPEVALPGPKDSQP